MCAARGMHSFIPVSTLPPQQPQLHHHLQHMPPWATPGAQPSRIHTVTHASSARAAGSSVPEHHQLLL